MVCVDTSEQAQTVVATTVDVGHDAGCIMASRDRARRPFVATGTGTGKGEADQVVVHWH